jgi:hypothetical protein
VPPGQLPSALARYLFIPTWTWGVVFGQCAGQVDGWSALWNMTKGKESKCNRSVVFLKL